MKDGQIYFNASYIQSGTLILGGLNNQNGTMLVLDANGNVAATITNLGMELNNGSVASYSADKLTRTMLANGIFAVQVYSRIAPVGWHDVLAMYRDSDGTHVSSPLNGTFFIQGGGRVNLTNKDASGGTPDLKYAIIDMDDDSVTISVIPNSGTFNTALIQFTPDLLKFMFGTRYEFDLSPGTSPHPLSIGNGGTGATTPANACDNLASGIPTAAYTLVPNSNYGPNVSGGSEPLRCIKYGNGLKRLVGLISITGNGAANSGTLCTVPSGFEHVNNNNGGLQGWGSITKSSGGESYLFRFSGNTVRFWGAAVPTGTYAVNYLYF
jgi:hypothetical protein